MQLRAPGGVAPTGRAGDEVQKGGEGLGDGDGLKLLLVALVAMGREIRGRRRGAVEARARHR